MRQKEVNFVSMCRSVQQVLAAHKDVWQQKQVFADQAYQLQRLFADLLLAMEHSELRSEGVTERKAEVELETIQFAVNLAKRASVYALERSDTALHDQLRISKSVLLRRPDNLVVSRLRDVHSHMRAHVPALDYYGVTAVDLDILKQMIDDFDKLISMPRTNIVTRKGFIQEGIPNLLNDIRYVLYKTDSLINLFADSVLEREYRHARMIMDMGGRHEQKPGMATEPGD